MSAKTKTVRYWAWIADKSRIDARRIPTPRSLVCNGPLLTRTARSCLPCRLTQQAGRWAHLPSHPNLGCRKPWPYQCVPRVQCACVVVSLNTVTGALHELARQYKLSRTNVPSNRHIISVCNTGQFREPFTARSQAASCATTTTPWRTSLARKQRAVPQQQRHGERRWHVPDAVHVGVEVCWKVEVDDMLHGRDVQAW
jgi:hypothetical protein